MPPTLNDDGGDDDGDDDDERGSLPPVEGGTGPWRGGSPPVDRGSMGRLEWGANQGRQGGGRRSSLPRFLGGPWDPPPHIRDRQNNNRSPRTPPGTTPQDHPPGPPPRTTPQDHPPGVAPGPPPPRGRDQREGASFMSVIMTLFDLVLAGSLEEEGLGKGATTTTTTTATATTTTTTKGDKQKSVSHTPTGSAD